MKYNQFSLLALLSLLLSPVMAADDIFGDSTGPTVITKAWKEAGVQIPIKISDSNLIKFKIFEMPQYQYFIDVSTLTPSKSDNVVRYAAVVRTPGGVRNIFYEGIRCDTGEYKLYATAIGDQRLIPVENPEWKAIQGQGVTVYRSDLYRDFLCRHSLIRGSKQDIIELMKYTPDSNDDSDLD